MEINFINLKSNKILKPTVLQIKDDIWNIKVNQHAILKLLRYERALRRQISANTKTRAQVRGGGKKPWKQKGTGRARQGSIRSPQWKGGGVVFGPNLNRNFKIKINKKVKKLAMKSALSAKINNSIVIAKPTLTKPSLKVMKTIFTDLKILITKRILVIDNQYDPILAKSLANFQKTKYITWRILNCYDLINADYLVFVKEAMTKINEVY